MGSSGTSLGQGVAQVVETPAEQLSPPAADESTDFPAELVGVWARTSNAGTSPSIEFAPTGERGTYLMVIGSQKRSGGGRPERLLSPA